MLRSVGEGGREAGKVYVLTWSWLHACASRRPFLALPLSLSSWILSKFCYSGLAMRLGGELADIPSKQEQLEKRGSFGGGKTDPIRHPTPRGLCWRSLLTHSGIWWKRRVPVETGPSLG